MKTTLTLIMLTLLTLCKGQDYKSNKQKYLKGYDTEWTVVTESKTVTIDNDKLFAELPTGETFTGTLKFVEQKTSAGKTGKQYEVSGGDIIVVYEDEIFLNLNKNKQIAITYYLTNYKDPNAEQQKAQDLEMEHAEYNANLQLYGKLTADCVRDKQVRVGMNYMGVYDILGKPTSINTTQTKNGLSQQFVYPNMYVYTEMQYVTAIQTIE